MTKQKRSSIISLFSLLDTLIRKVTKGFKDGQERKESGPGGVRKASPTFRPRAVPRGLRRELAAGRVTRPTSWYLPTGVVGTR